MTTKALFVSALGGLLPISATPFARTSGNILTAVGHGLQTGAGPFKCMSTSGADLPAGLTAAVRASTFVTGTAVIATDVLIVAGKSYTIIATPAADGHVDLGADDPTTMGNLARAINLGTGAGTSYDIAMTGNPSVSAEALATVLTITAKTLDATVGNAIAVSSPDATLVVDNATLEGGATGTDYYVIRLTDDTFSLATSRELAVAGTAVALSDAGTGVHTLVRTVQTLADSIEQVLVNQLTATGRRVNRAADNIAAFWANVIDGLAN